MRGKYIVGGWDAKVQKGLGNVQSADVLLFVDAFQAHYKLVHAGCVVSYRIEILQLFLHVVGVENRVLCQLRNSVGSIGKKECKGSYHYQEVSVETCYAADAVLGLCVFSVNHSLSWEELCQEIFAATWTASRTAAAVRSGEGLMEIQVDNIESDISRTNDADNRIQVGTVVVAETAGFVNETGDLQDVFVEKDLLY